MSSLTNRVRGEFVPIEQGSLHLLEVIYDEAQNPFWKARCMQTGNVLRFLAQVVCGLAMFTYVVWGIQILWGF